MTVAEELPGATVWMAGTPGTVTGVTGFDGAEGVPAPTALVAVTTKV